MSGRKLLTGKQYSSNKHDGRDTTEQHLSPPVPI